MKPLTLSPDLKLPAELAGEAVAILATRGAGKSFASAVLAEELYGVGVQFCILDPTGVYWGLRSSADGKRAGLPIYILGGQHGDVPIEPGAGALIADVLVDTGQSLVLDLSAFHSKGEQTRFVTAFAERLYRRKANHRTTLHLIVDEADEFAPQRPMRDEARMLGAMEAIVRRGRSRGLGVALITQRSAVLNKNVLDLVDTLMIMRMGSPRDHKAVQGWIAYQNAEDRAGVLSSLPSLPTGTAWAWSPVRDILQRIKVRRIRTFDSYATPKPGQKRVEPLLQAALDIAALGEQIKATAERARENDPGEMKAEIARLRKALADKPAATDEADIQMRITTATQKNVAALQLEFGKRLAAALRKVVDVETATKELSAVLTDTTDELLARRVPESQSMASTKQAKIIPKNIPAPAGNGALSGPEQRILDAIAWMESIGVPEPEQSAVAFLAGYRVNGGAFNNPKGRLRVSGYIEYLPGRRLRLTDRGRAIAQAPSLPQTKEALHEAVLSRLDGPEQRLLRPLLGAYPDSLSNEDLAAAAGYTPNAGAYNNPRGRLRMLGLVDYPRPGHVVAREILFP
jgi:hypothetical protein